MKVEGEHTGFLRHIPGKRVRWIGDRMWETRGAEVVREAAVMQSAMNYIGRQQETMSQWVALQPLFEVCVGGKGYYGGERIR